jgi:hypothetical protein
LLDPEFGIFILDPDPAIPNYLYSEKVGQFLLIPLRAPDEDAADHHHKGGQPHKVLARGEVHPMDPFQGQNRINKEKV